jgi:alpha-glucosidase (family GH31 glycosyl hydrolase)
MPYIWQEAQHSAASGEPMMRALALTEPQASPYQYTFGRDLLVCPVVEPGAQSWPVYLPEGQWTSLLDSRALRGRAGDRASHPTRHVAGLRPAGGGTAGPPAARRPARQPRAVQHPAHTILSF